MHLLRDLWDQLWPNLVATPLTAGPMFLWHHRRIKAHISAAAQGRAQQPEGTRPATDIRLTTEQMVNEIRRWDNTRPGYGDPR